MATPQTTNDYNHHPARINCVRYDLPGLGPVTRGMIQRARQNDSHVNQTSVATAAVVPVPPPPPPPPSVILNVEQQREAGKTKVVAKSANEKLLNFSLNISPIDGDVNHAASLVVNNTGRQHKQPKSLIQVDIDRCHSVELVYQQKY
jgi:hypothetical protein